MWYPQADSSVQCTNMVAVLRVLSGWPRDLTKLRLATRGLIDPNKMCQKHWPVPVRARTVRLYSYELVVALAGRRPTAAGAGLDFRTTGMAWQ
eukprot:COSAG01_NODE_22702_length_845_cov_0.808311_1_plen_92_part_10